MLSKHWYNYKAKIMQLLSPECLAEGKNRMSTKNTFSEFPKFASFWFSVLWYTLSSSNSTRQTSLSKVRKRVIPKAKTIKRKLN